MMKKLLAPCLALMLVTLTACGSTAAQPPQEPAALEAAPSATPAAICYEVRTTTLEDSAFDTDGTQLAHYRYDLPTLTAVRADGTDIVVPGNNAEEKAKTTADTFNSRFDKWAKDSDFSDTVRQAEEDRSWRVKTGQEWTGGYEEELSYTVWRTDRLVSISASYYSDTGGVHPNTVLLGWNYDLQTGAFISPLVLADDEQAFLKGVTEEIIRQADQTARENGFSPEEYYLENYAGIAAEWTNYAVSFDDDGLTVGFSPYEMACYAAGPQVFNLSYEFLSPWLSDAGRQTLGLVQDGN